LRPQAKLNISQPGDMYEQEADMMASRVMSMSSPTLQRDSMLEEEEVQMKPLGEAIAPRVQGEAIPEEEEVEEDSTKSLNASIPGEISPEEEEIQTKRSLQRATDGSLQAGGNIESRLNSSKGGGSPLANNVRGFMEPRFGTDFSQVRVHTGEEAVQMNRELGAQAFAHGSDIYFGAGKSPGNNELTAHELTHVVQQGGDVHKKAKSDIPTIQSKCFVCEREKQINRAVDLSAYERTHVVQQINGVQFNRISNETLVQMKRKGGESKICHEKPEFKDTSPVPVDILADSFSEFVNKIVPQLGGDPHMQPHYTWHLELDNKGRVTAVNMKLETTILRPRWSGGRPNQKDADLINKAVELIKGHEENHRSIERQNAESAVCNAIGKSEATALKTINEAIKKSCKEQENFDLKNGSIKGVKGSNGDYADVMITSLPKKPNYSC
jgi:hypothetical protein